MLNFEFAVGSDTSRAAAESVSEVKGWMRRRVWKALNRRGDRGATDEELQRALRMNPSTERPRRVELVESELVIDSGRRRPTRSGRMAVVWTVREREQV